VNHLAVELDCAPEAAAEVVARAADEWGAEWQPGREGGRLVLPVVFGLRRGVAVGRLDIARLGAGSRLTWELEESHLEVHRAAVAVLAFAALALLVAMAWPFHPPLVALLPFALVLGFLAWWLVVSRLRSSGPEEFLATLRAAAPEPAGAATPPPA
jgi:hypothetical protein